MVGSRRGGGGDARADNLRIYRGEKTLRIEVMELLEEYNAYNKGKDL